MPSLKINQEISVELVKHRLSRRFKISVNSSGQVRLTMPRYMPWLAGQMFVREKEQWIIQTVDKLKAKTKGIQISRQEVNAYIRWAKQDLPKLAEEYARMYQVSFKRIAIRNQRSRWGSCSRQKNLNFNWRLMLLPENIRRYIVVHEVCHLLEMNHSRRFWQLVAVTLPDYNQCRRWLRSEEGRALASAEIVG